jgi:hypothetical protein
MCGSGSKSSRRLMINCVGRVGRRTFRASWRPWQLLNSPGRPLLLSSVLSSLGGGRARDPESIQSHPWKRNQSYLILPLFTRIPVLNPAKVSSI